MTMTSSEKEKLRTLITWAIQSYSQSERTALSYHDPAMRESAYEAMEKLNKEAQSIADYALLGLERKENP
jgi:hypothetical protein